MAALTRLADELLHAALDQLGPRDAVVEPRIDRAVGVESPHQRAPYSVGGLFTVDALGSTARPSRLRLLL